MALTIPNEYGGLMEEVSQVSAWRGLLPILAKYKAATQPHEKASVLFEVVHFALERLEGDDVDSSLRKALTLAAETLRTSGPARELARVLYEG